MSIFARQYIHNARNRLMHVAEQLGKTGQDELSLEVQRSSNLLTCAMALLKLDDADTVLSILEVNLEAFFRELSSQAETLCPAPLTLHCSADYSLCTYPVWTFDEELVRLVIMDAVMNAVRYARHRVSLSSTWKAGELSFLVHDDGPGFPASILENQGREVVAKAEGTGNGLYLARQIAERHQIDGKGGRIELFNDTENGGAVFRLVLP